MKGVVTLSFLLSHAVYFSFSRSDFYFRQSDVEWSGLKDTIFVLFLFLTRDLEFEIMSNYSDLKVTLLLNKFKPCHRDNSFRSILSRCINKQAFQYDEFRDIVYQQRYIQSEVIRFFSGLLLFCYLKTGSRRISAECHCALRPNIYL